MNTYIVIAVRVKPSENVVFMVINRKCSTAAASAHFGRWTVENECLTTSTTCTIPSPVDEAQGMMTCDWSGTKVGVVKAW